MLFIAPVAERLVSPSSSVNNTPPLLSVNINKYGKGGGNFKRIFFFFSYTRGAKYATNMFVIIMNIAAPSNL